MSSEYDMIYVQEATELSEDDWESLTTRLRNGKVSFQQLMADCNPGPPHHWLNRRSTAGRCHMIYCKHEDNPRLFASGEWTPEGNTYIERLEALTGVRKQRLRWGKWAAAEGLVYEGWDPELHVREGFQSGSPPAEWPRYLAVDFGFTNPFVCQWWAIDPDGRLFMFREIYRTRRLVEEHADTIMEHLATSVARNNIEPMPLLIICDHDAEDRATLEKHLNIPTIPAIKTVSDGIQAVASRLKIQPDGKPRLQICRNSLIGRDPLLDDAKKPACTLDEVYEYIWDPNTARNSSTSRMGNTAREQPLKQNDHGMDALRYMVAFFDVRKIVKLRGWI
jgi:phage terminase large subunit